ncbi:MAG: hypothetical protein IPI29_10045 [Ignavibacteria bacterium]|nr:hypothetical protein [Ignavibacteria bacterium]
MTIDVLTMQGRTIKHQEERGRSGQFTVPIDLIHVAHGVYIIRVSTSTTVKSVITSW